MPIDKLIIKQRLVLICENIEELKLLAQMPKDEFLKKRNAAAAESFLRRSLEAVFDIGRHILAKQGQLNMALEYKSIARGLYEKGIVSQNSGEKLLQMAGYRNRMVHLYHQISEGELYEIINHNLKDLERIKEEIMKYIA